MYSNLKEHLRQPEISLILGPRQVGKTTLMKRLAGDLNSSYKPNIYFNLDIIEDRQYFTTQHTLIDRIKKKIASEKATVFIDEIQRLTNAGLFLKGLYDLGTKYKFVVSGSGSLELKANIIEPMTGRKKIFYLQSLSFTEFAANKLNSRFEEVEQVLESNPFEKDRLINEYLFYGGYPRVVLAQTYEKKMDLLSEIYRSYLEKDIQLILKVEKEASFQLLVKILASCVGNIINKAELASSCAVNEKTIGKYLDLLEKTYVISLVRPYFTNVRRELRKSPKVYFTDMGFLNLARGRSTESLLSGNVFENACYLRLKELETFEPIHFWRSVSGAEVDFILHFPNNKLVPIEVKLTPTKIGTLGKSLINFLIAYKAKEAYIYNKDKRAYIEKFAAKIRYLPYHLLPRI